MKRRTVEVTCTDRGAHPRRMLGKAKLHDAEGGLGALPGFMRGSSDSRRTRRGDDRETEYSSEGYYGQGRLVLRFTCPTCHRDVRLTEATIRKLADGRVATVDVSMLPANLS